MSMMVSFVLSFFPRDVLDEILNLIESVSEDFPSYSYINDQMKICFARGRLFFDLCLRSLRFCRRSTFSNIFSSETTGPTETKFNAMPLSGLGNKSLLTGFGSHD